MNIKEAVKFIVEKGGSIYYEVKTSIKKRK